MASSSRRRRLSSESSSYNSCSSGTSYYDFGSSLISDDDDDEVTGGSNACTSGKLIETRTFFDDVKVILSRHDSKLSRLEDDLSCVVRWLNKKFGFILKYESTPSIPGMWEEHDHNSNVTNSDDAMTEGRDKGALTSSPSVGSNLTPAVVNESCGDEAPEAAENDYLDDEQNDLHNEHSCEQDTQHSPNDIDIAHENNEEYDPTNQVILPPKHPRDVVSPNPVATVKKTPRSPTKRVRSSSTTTVSKDPQRPSQCDTCGKFLKDPASLRQHKKIHLNIRPFTCTEPDCGKSFRRKFHLQTHALIHKGVKDHQCGYCGRCFLLQKDLITHERIHTGERPFNCPECPKSFALKSHLVMHVRTHTGEKPYECEVCNKTFTQSNTLRLHKKKLHQETSSISPNHPQSSRKKSEPRKSKTSKVKEKSPESTSLDTATVVTSPPVTPAKLPIYRNQSSALSTYRNVLTGSRLTPTTVTILQQPMIPSHHHHSIEFLEPIDASDKIILTESTLNNMLSIMSPSTSGNAAAISNHPVPLLSSEILNLPQHLLIPRNNNL